MSYRLHVAIFPSARIGFLRPQANQHESRVNASEMPRQHYKTVTSPDHRHTLTLINMITMVFIQAIMYNHVQSCKQETLKQYLSNVGLCPTIFGRHVVRIHSGQMKCTFSFLIFANIYISVDKSFIRNYRLGHFDIHIG